MNSLTYPTSEDCEISHRLQTEQTTYSDYYFFKQNPTSSDLTLIGGGVEHCRKDFEVTREHFMYYAVEYIASGNCRLTIGDKTYELGAGTVFTYGPHLPHTIESIGDDPVIKYFINFTGNDVLDNISRFFLKDGIPITLKNLKWIGDIFLQIQECGTTKDPNAQDLCSHLVRYLISRVENLEDRMNTPISPSYFTYQTCRSYIESRFLKIRSISEVADACNVSICHVSRLFRKYAEVSPCTLLTSLKLNRSRELLKDPNLLVKQVAEKVGIDDQYYFSNRFKQFFGVSPQNYKRTIKKGDPTAA